MVIFRENSEDIYADIEYEAQSDKPSLTDRRQPMVQVQEPENGPGHHRQGRDCRRLPAANPATPGRILGGGHAEPEGRLHL